MASGGHQRSQHGHARLGTITQTSPGWWIYIYDNGVKEFITDIGKTGATLKRLRPG